MPTDLQITEQQQASIHQWTWKTEAMRHMTLAVVRLALARGLNGEFSALDLPLRGALSQGGSGIAGTVFKNLKDAGLICRVGVFVGGAFYPRNVINDGGNPVGVYRLAHPGMARALLAIHAPHELPKLEQQELSLCFSRQLVTGKGSHASDAVDARPVTDPGTGIAPIVKGTETASAADGQQGPALMQADGNAVPTFLPVPSLGKSSVPEFQSLEKTP